MKGRSRLNNSMLTELALFLLDILNAWMLAFSASMIFQCVLEKEISWKPVLIICLILVPFLMLLIRVTLFRRIVLFAVGAFLLALLIMFGLWSMKNARLHTLFNPIFEWIGQFFTLNDITVLAPYLITAIICAFASAITLVGKRLLYPAVLLPVAAIIILSLFSASFPLPELTMYMLASIALVLRKKTEWFESLLSGWAKKGRVVTANDNTVVAVRASNMPGKLSRSAVIMLAAVILFAALSPVKVHDGPLLGEDVSSFIENKFEEFVNSSPLLRKLFRYESSSGNSKTIGAFGQIDGPAALGNEPILMVKTSDPGGYLRGFTYSNYVGNGWKKEKPDSLSYMLGYEYSAPIGTSASIAVPYADDELSLNPISLAGYGIIKQKTLTVHYVDSYDARFGFFVPSTARVIRFYDDDLVFYNSYSQLHLETTTGRSIAYTANKPQDWDLYEVRYYDVTDGMIEDLKLYEVCSRGYYSRLSGSYSHSRATQFRNWADVVYKRYTEYPDSLPYRIKGLAEGLTKGLKDDWHKALAIKNYLLSGQYKYTLTPPSTPSRRDAVDFFLFDSHEGYCTYFASAMTLLCRAAGIPARYVEGFYVSPDARTEDSDIYLLTEEHLHAWCEIYMEGLGFVTMEATAGRGTPSEEQSTDSPVSTDAPATASPSPSPSPTATPSPSVSPEDSPEPTETASPSSSGDVPETPEPTELPSETPSSTVAEITGVPATEEPLDASGGIKFLIILTIIIILIAGGTVIIIVAAKRKRGREDAVYVRIRSAYSRSRSLFEAAGVKKEETDTPDEYSKKVIDAAGTGKKALPEDAAKAFERLTRIYELTEYGEDEPDESLFKEAAACRGEITKAFCDKFGKVRTRLLQIRKRGSD